MNMPAVLLYHPQRGNSVNVKPCTSPQGFITAGSDRLDQTLTDRIGPNRKGNYQCGFKLNVNKSDGGAISMHEIVILDMNDSGAERSREKGLPPQARR